MILSAIAFIIVLSILVLVHEFGHFITAKKAGVKVEEFAFGFPPRLWSKKVGETTYAINAIPFGGYVKMLGELEHSNHPRAFENQTPGKRFAIAIAGVMMNFLLAWFVLTVGFAVGMPALVTSPDALPGEKVSSAVVVADVVEGGPAAQAGLKSGDTLISARSGNQTAEFKSVKDVGAFTREHRGQAVVISYNQTDQRYEKEIVLSTNPDAPLGVALGEQAVVRIPWYKAPYVALYETTQIVRQTFVMLGGIVSNFFQHGEVSDGVGGPVAIYVYSGLAIRAGLIAFMQFIAILSINLGLINILPFPALDGGRLIFIIMEKIRGSKVVREEIENLVHTIGFIVLIILILAITYRDIIKLF